MATIPDAAAPPQSTSESLEERFQRLASTWHQAVAHHSSSRVRYGHPAYQEIIRLGPAVVPLLLRDLEVNRRHWFAALTVLTGADPVPEGDAGKVAAMREAWLRWGKEQGHRW